MTSPLRHDAANEPTGGEVHPPRAKTPRVGGLVANERQHVIAIGQAASTRKSGGQIGGTAVSRDPCFHPEKNQIFLDKRRDILDAKLDLNFYEALSIACLFDWQR